VVVLAEIVDLSRFQQSARADGLSGVLVPRKLDRDKVTRAAITKAVMVVARRRHSCGGGL